MEQCSVLFEYFQGFFLKGLELDRESAEYVFTLEPEQNAACTCCRCGRSKLPVHDRTIRRVRDLPVFGLASIIEFPRRRVLCPDCGPQLELLCWLDPHMRLTRRLAENITQLLQAMTVRQVSRMYRLDWKTVKNIDKRDLKIRLGGLDMNGVNFLAMDEFAIQKGHRYATVIIEPNSRRVLWVCRGRAREDVRPFFESLTDDQSQAIRAVAMDMTASYQLEVERYCPNAVVVFDLFHVVAKYGREVIDRVRVDVANELRHDKAARRLVKGMRWMLLRNAENITSEKDRIRLRELLDANEALSLVYILKDQLKQLWKYRHQGYARRAWQEWKAIAEESMIEPLLKFVARLEPYIPGIISHARWPLNTSVLEGINNRIKVIKRMAYGYRDDEYFFLKIKNAFPGIGL